VPLDVHLALEAQILENCVRGLAAGEADIGLLREVRDPALSRDVGDAHAAPVESGRQVDVETFYGRLEFGRDVPAFNFAVDLELFRV